MRFLQPLVAGRFVCRDNRFRATVDINESPHAVHVPNSGRLRELLVPGAEVRLSPAQSLLRLTAYDLTLVRTAETWVCVDARLPPRLLGEWLAADGGSLSGWEVERAEVLQGDSRLDLLLRRGSDLCWLETKSVTLVRDGVGLFPDAPTERGRRHLEELGRAAEAGIHAAVVFVVQRADATSFTPNDATDPAFGQALRRAVASGVRAICCRCEVDETGVRIGFEIPVNL